MGTASSLNLISLSVGREKMRPVAPTSGASARSREPGRQVSGTRVSLGAEDGVSPPLRLREPKPHPVAHARGPQALRSTQPAPKPRQINAAGRKGETLREAQTPEET